MAAGRTYTPIATQTLTSAAADITFTSVSGAYTDILIIGSVRSTRTAGAGALGIRVNNDSTSLYSSTRIYSNTSSGTAGSDRFSGTYFEIGEMASASGVSNIFTPLTAHFNNYSNTTTFKTILGTTRRSENSTGVQQMVGLYRSTSALTQFKIYDAYGGNLEIGTMVTLYGILAA
jgi:hypothetical protein